MNYVFLSGFSLIWFVSLVLVIGLVFRWVHKIYDADERRQKQLEEKDNLATAARISKSIATDKLDILERVLYLSDSYNVKPELLVRAMQQDQPVNQQTVEVPTINAIVRR